MDQTLQSTLSKVEYLTTFNAFIFSYIISRFFLGWGRWINSWRHLNFSLPYIGWSFLGFLLLIELWWCNWAQIAYIDRTPFTFYASILIPFILYLITALYFPPLAREITNISKYNLFQRRKGYFFFACLFGTSLVAAFFVVNLRWTVIYNAIGLALALISFLFPKRTLENISLALLYLATFGFFIIIPDYTHEKFWIVKGLSFAEYNVIFTTFIFAFIITRLLDGWAYFVLNRKSLRINLEYVLWTLVLFGLIIDFWRGMWDRHVAVSSNFLHFLASIIPAFGFYLIVLLLLPEQKPVKSSFVDYFTRNSRIIYVLLIIVFGFDFLTALLTGNNVLFGVENLFRLITIILCLIAIYLNNKKTNRIMLIIFWIELTLHNILNYLQ